LQRARFDGQKQRSPLGAVAEVPRPGSSGDLKESKIVELAKKNRALSLSLEKERAKAGRLAQEIRRLQEDVVASKQQKDLSGMDARSLPKGSSAGGKGKGEKEGSRRSLAFGGPVDEPKDAEEVPAEQRVKELSGKVQALNAQITSQRVQNDKLKQEVGKVREALKRELGDVPVERALEDAGGWTGRAQQISLLQSKVAQLKRELQSSLETKLRSPERGSVQGSFPTSPMHDRPVDNAARVDDLHRAQIEKVERDRRREAEQLQEQLQAERAEKEALKRRAESKSLPARFPRVHLPVCALHMRIQSSSAATACCSVVPAGADGAGASADRA
jgi:hypothetical protein